MKRSIPILTLVLGAILFLAGAVYLFLLRFEMGDVYPPYSSLRADPLGSMAFAESLARLPGLQVRQDFSTANRLPEERNTTYLHLAAEASDWRWLPADLFHEIEAFATRGGRLVVTMRPVYGPSPWLQPPGSTLASTNASATNAPGTPAGGVSPKKSSRPRPDQPLDAVSLERRWGLAFAHVKLSEGFDGVFESVEVLNRTDLPLPQRLEWHSALVLTNLDRSWRTIYARGKHPVLVEREFGRGSVVIATDSYFVSNEAMWKAREPRLLAWLIGPGTQVAFDEAHLGVTEAPGVAVLMRRYRLEGLVGGLAVLALLFIWKNTSSLVPAYADPAHSDQITGRDAAAGFVNLLRRNIAPADILNVCFNEWTKSLPQRGPVRIVCVDAAQAVMEAERIRPPRAGAPVRAYRDICAALKSSRNSEFKTGL